MAFGEREETIAGKPATAVAPKARNLRRVGFVHFVCRPAALAEDVTVHHLM